MLGLLLIVMAIGLLAHAASRHRSIALAVLAATFAVFYGVRAFGIALRLDEPFPEYLFATSDIANLMARFGVMVAAFCMAIVFAHNYAGPFAETLAGAFPYVRDRLRRAPLFMATISCTAVAALIALFVISSVGGIEQSIVEAKSERVGSSSFLRMPAMVALVLACGLFHRSRLEVAGEVNPKIVKWSSAACAVIAALSISIWGSRQFIVVAAAFLIGAPAIAAFRNARRGWLVRSALVLLLIIAIGFALRVYRDDALGGETAVSSAQGDIFRQVSVSVNGIMLDSSLLAVRDWPERHAWRDGADFVDGFLAGIPAPLRPAEATSEESMGAQFHRIYEPFAQNGWPIGAPTEWYINLGWFGVLLGGALTGWIFRAMTYAHHRSREPELAGITSLVLAIVVFPLGLSVSSMNRFVVYAVPLALMLWVIAGVSREPSSARRSRLPAAPR